MHAFLITSRTNKAADRKIPYPFELKKIDDVRALGRFTRLSLNQKTAVIIKEFDKASEPAQNAFLKSLEEPQENLIYILTASSENSVLPTILSRCQLININNQPKISKEEIKKAKKFFSQSTIKKLETISRISSKNTHSSPKKRQPHTPAYKPLFANQYILTSPPVIPDSHCHFH